MPPILSQCPVPADVSMQQGSKIILMLSSLPFSDFHEPTFLAMSLQSIFRRHYYHHSVTTYYYKINQFLMQLSSSIVICNYPVAPLTG